MVNSPPSLTATKFQWLHNIETCLSWLVIGVLVFQVLIVAIFSFQFRPIDDSSFIYYLTWLINERGYHPYVDLHETSFPGTFLVYSLITRVTGYSSTGFNATHILLLSLLSIASYGFLRRIHPRMAIIATLMFASSYLLMHNSVYMQRDFVALFFVIIACNTMTSRWPLPLRSCITGALFGLVASIKPQLALSAPFVVLFGVYIYSNDKKYTSPHVTLIKKYIIAAVYSFLCFALVILAFIGWLIISGSWNKFIHMLINYMPLYEMLSGVEEPLTQQDRWQRGFDWLLGALPNGAIPALIGMIAIRRNQTLVFSQKKLINLIIICWIIYIVCVPLAGKFYDYHQIPPLYFNSCIVSLYFIPTTITCRSSAILRIVYLVLAIPFIQASINPNYAWAMTCHNNNPICMTPERADYDAEDRLAEFLQKNLQPGEHVEPLATAVMGRVFPALLKARVEPVTPYLEGFPFYHHIKQHYIQNIRADAMRRLEQTPPRFFIAPQSFFPIQGNESTDFNALGEFIRNRYALLDKHMYPILHDPMPVTIYELKKP